MSDEDFVIGVEDMAQRANSWAANHVSHDVVNLTMQLIGDAKTSIEQSYRLIKSSRNLIYPTQNKRPDSWL